MHHETARCPKIYNRQGQVSFATPLPGPWIPACAGMTQQSPHRLPRGPGCDRLKLPAIVAISATAASYILEENLPIDGDARRRTLLATRRRKRPNFPERS